MIRHFHETILGDLPAGWSAQSLERILLADYPGDWGSDAGEVAVTCIRGTNFTSDGSLDLEKRATRFLPRKKASLLEPRQGDVFLEKSGGGPDQPVGRVGCAKSDLPRFSFSNFVHLLRPNPEAVMPLYLGRLLAEVYLSGVIVRMEQQTTGIRNLNLGDYLDILLPLPPPDEQAAIVRILDAADTAIERARTAVGKAQRVKRSLVQALFMKGLRRHAFHKTPLGSLPADWNVVPVGEVLTEAQYGLSMPMLAKGDYPILRMAAIQGGRVLLSDLKYVNLPKPLAEQYLLRRGDVLFNRTNSFEHVGKVGIFRSERPAVFASYLIRLQTKPETIDNFYLGHLLSSYAVQCRIRRYATPGVQQVNINASNLKRVLIPVPGGEKGLDEQRDIARVLEQEETVITAAGNRVTALERLKRGLMQDLLTGRVRVKPAPEPDAAVPSCA